MTGSSSHSVPFPVSGSTWHLQTISHHFLGLSCCCLHCHSRRTLPPWVVYVLDIVVPAYWNDTMHNRWRLDYLGNYPYPGVYCSSTHPISMIIVWNQLTRVGTLPETSWWSFHHLPPHTSFWFPRVSWLCIFLSQMLKWTPQNFCSRLWWVHLTLVVDIKWPLWQ